MHTRFPIPPRSLGATLWLGAVLGILPGSLAAGEPLALRDAVDRALRQNLGLQIDRYAPEDRRTAVETAQSEYDPSLSLLVDLQEQETESTSSATSGTQSDRRNYHASARQKLAWGTSVELGTGWNRSDSNAVVNFSNLDYQADLGLTVRQPLLRGAGRTVNLAPLRSAEAGWEGAVQQFRGQVLDLLARTETAYWDLAFARDRLSLSQSSLSVAEKLLEETREKWRLGLATEVEVLEAEASLAARREEIVLATRQWGDADDALRRELGELSAPAAAPAEVDAPGWTVEPLPDEPVAVADFQGGWERALAGEPALRQQDAVIEQAQWEVRASRNGLLPAVDLTARGSFLGRDNLSARDSYQGALERDGHYWSLGLEVTYPWGRRAEKARHRQATLALGREETRLIDLKNALYQDYRSRWRAAVAGREQLAATATAERLQERVFAQRKARFDSGLATFREVLEAQRDLDAARLRRLQAVVGVLQADLSLARLDGSLLARHGFSWEAAESLVPPPPVAK